MLSESYFSAIRCSTAGRSDVSTGTSMYHSHGLGDSDSQSKPGLPVVPVGCEANIYTEEFGACLTLKLFFQGRENTLSISSSTKLAALFLSAVNAPARASLIHLEYIFISQLGPPPCSCTCRNVNLISSCRRPWDKPRQRKVCICGLWDAFSFSRT